MIVINVRLNVYNVFTLSHTDKFNCCDNLFSDWKECNTTREEINECNGSYNGISCGNYATCGGTSSSMQWMC